MQFRGNRKVEDDAIRANLLTRIGGDLELDRVREDVRAIWKLGFFRDVQVEARPAPSGGVIVVFAVEEKPSVRKILVSGNDEVTLTTADVEREFASTAPPGDEPTAR